jgi:cytoskeletal protein RodZ
LLIDQTPYDFGAALRALREQAGTTLRQIADTTKLPLISLQALEDNRIDRLPGGIYRRSIVRSYAAEIGIDPQETLRVFLSLYPDDVPSSAPQTAAPVTAVPVIVAPKRQLPRALGATRRLFGSLIPVLAGVVYFWLLQ